jgi:signal peptidase I
MNLLKKIKSIKNNEWLKSEIKDFFKDLAIIVVVVIFIRTFIAMPFQISWQSMYESYYDKWFIIVDRVSYLFWNPKRGDVVVFKPNVNNDKKYFLKRIIWIPGDTIKIEDGQVYTKSVWTTDFQLLEESYLNIENRGYTFIGISKAPKIYELGKGDYFVMWDNRNHSTDSRECFSNCAGRSEFVSKKDIIWKVFMDLWYFNLKQLSFIHPNLGIVTTPKFFSSQSTYNYGF